MTEPAALPSGGIVAYWTDMRELNNFGGVTPHGEDAFFGTAPSAIPAQPRLDAPLAVNAQDRAAIPAARSFVFRLWPARTRKS